MTTAYKPKVGMLWPKQERFYGRPVDEILALRPTCLITGGEYEGLKDFAGFARRGVLNGQTLVNARTGPDPDFVFKRAADDPANGRIDVDEFPMGAGGPRSFMAWLIRDNNSANYGVFSGNGGALGFDVSVLTTGVVRARIQQGDTTAISQVSSGASFPNGSWAHLGVTFDLPNDTVEIVLNGTSLISQAGMTKDWGNNLGIRLMTGAGGSPLDGGGYCMAAFERALTVAEYASIAALT